MSANYASITIIGRLGHDPSTRQVGENTVTSFNIAVSEKTKGEESTSWYNASAWNKQGTIIEQYAKKGDLIMIQGKPRIEEYTGKDGTAKTKVSVRVSDFTLLGGKKDVAQESGKPVEKAQTYNAKPPSAADDANNPPF